MDAAVDRDIELQRASGELIEEFRTRLPPLLWKCTGRDNRVAHRWAKAATVEKLTLLLEPFQEWPQLLDPHLNWILTHLNDAFLAYLQRHRQSYGSFTRTKGMGVVFPLARGICKLLYTLCKVRGPKVVIRFFSNEPKYLEPMLSTFIEWDAIVSTDIGVSSMTGQGLPLNWEERYVMLLWLSHLLLAPFDLSSISSGVTSIPYNNISTLQIISPKVPQIALSILSVSLKYAVLPGKEREGAVLLLSRLVLRRDMQQIGVLDSVLSWTLSSLRPDESSPSPSTYTCIGLLSFLAKLGTLAQVEDIGPFVQPIVDRIISLSKGHSEVSMTVQSSAATRKLLIKILREMTTLSLTLENRPGHLQLSADKVSNILEDTIDYLLIAVGDKDTPVRFTASKALSMIALRLDPSLGVEILDAIIGLLEEDVFYEKEEGTLISRAKAQSNPEGLVVKNISSVDAQKWHGLMLTLGHLLFRRSPPLDRLPQLLACLVTGQTFEQRSSTGASIGVIVRDASCFGIWSLARKYSTKELECINLDTTITGSINKNILQSLAIELVTSACLDSSGNIRRGSSAALQELIGRHPDSIHEGISIVQTVDYHSVARREIAMTEVAKAAAHLDNVYWSPLLDALMRWRGIGAPDPKYRRAAASAIGDLSLQLSHNGIGIAIDRLMHILSTSSSNSVEVRHGGFLALAGTVDAFIRYQTTKFDAVNDSEALTKALLRVNQLWNIFDSPLEPSVESLTVHSFRPDLTAEACSRLISSLSRCCVVLKDHASTTEIMRPSNDLLERTQDILLLCVQRNDDEPAAASSQAAADFFALLPPEKRSRIIQKWFVDIRSCWNKAAGRGQIAALGAVYRHFPAGGYERQSIFNELVRYTGPDESIIAKRVSAVNSLFRGVLPYLDAFDDIENHTEILLNDYTTDNRGDVGSLIRIEAIEGVTAILESQRHSLFGASKQPNIMKHIVRLAAEKMDKARFKAWKCLQIFWESDPSFPKLTRRYGSFSEVSSADYFSHLINLLQVDWLRIPLLKGLTTSLSAGTDSLINSARTALVHFMNNENNEAKCSLRKEVFANLLVILEDVMRDDRYAIPVVESFAFLLENCFQYGTLELAPDCLRRLFVLVQKFHFKTTNIPKIEAALRVYYCLYDYEATRKDAAAKMTSMLLHPYPKIRTIASEYIFVKTEDPSLIKHIWASPPKHLKPVVDRFRQSFSA